MQHKLLLLNGPNINLLGDREKNIYGSVTLKSIEAELSEVTRRYGVALDCFQSNHEGELIDSLHNARDSAYIGIIFNPGAYTHTSIALRDAIAAINIPVIEVHITNIHQRESFRHQSMLAAVCYGQIVGLGKNSYRLAAWAFLENELERNDQDE